MTYPPPARQILSEIWYRDSYWDDLRFPAQSAKQGANAKPDYDYTNCGYLFAKNTDTEKLYMVAQLPHKYKEGTALNCHIHWVQTSALFPIWKMSYRWHGIGESASGGFTTVQSNTGVITYPGAGNIHQLTEFTAITGANHGISSILDLIVWREDNVIDGDVLYKEFDIHYQINAPGSRWEYRK